MSINAILAVADIIKAVQTFAVPGSFNPRQFFTLVGLESRGLGDLQIVFNILDTDVNEFLEEGELALMMKAFSPDARALTAEEAKALLSAGDKDGDGKINFNEFVAMVKGS